MHIKIAFQYSMPVVKIYGTRNMYYRFEVLKMNIETQSKHIHLAENKRPT